MSRPAFPITLLALLGLAQAAPAPTIDTSQMLRMTPQRTQLTLEYIRQHYDAKATSIQITPLMIVIHWTATGSLKSTLNTFKPEVLSGRTDIQKGGKLNTGAHYVVDRDGTIYQLMNETDMARHVIGLNRFAIGIENVGNNDLTPAQLKANTQLVNYLHEKYGVQYLIGHHEYGQFRGTPLWEEKDPTYFTVKSDPGAAFMAQLRAALKSGGVTFRALPK